MKERKILVAGGSGMVGSSILRKLKEHGYNNLLLPKRSELDLLDQSSVYHYLNKNKPDFIFIAAAKVGGILANDNFSADFLFENLQIQNNLIHGAHLADINNIIFLGSSCVYPRMAPQPIKEEYLLTGPFEKTNEGYAIAKISGIKLCEHYKKQYNRNYYSVMPTNLYGPNDNFDLNSSHVIPALLRKFHEAKNNDSPSVTLWGDGSPLREFLHVDDCASACLFLMNEFNDYGPVNVGTGSDISILNLAKLIADKIAFKGEILLDSSKPNGTPKKQLDVSKINDLGWKASIALDNGIESVCLILDDELKVYQ